MPLNFISTISTILPFLDCNGPSLPSLLFQKNWKCILKIKFHMMAFLFLKRRDMKKVANFEGYFPLTIVLLTRMVCVSFGKNSMHFSNASLNEECKEKMLLSRGAGKFQLSFLEYKSTRLWLVFFCCLKIDWHK